ncbi:iron uptake system protein EfeO [Branchiibius sp. NY16-3462-2]|uniref:iron uptake system protein EfeO n=1 Tax=Branchiibius sp. NY16-3462-2 TaxID=1807500 RepID=UPI00079ABA8A|nr:iron uptake system protein EfeO [Branchiibius sp. NY16-3462-2]KYH45523.1 peptidase M75 [Branchiibius sp. NY16-3462-2]
MSSFPRSATVAVAGAALCTALAACGSGTSAGAGSSAAGSTATSGAATGAPVKNGAAQVAITLKDNDCSVDHTTAAAGPVTFTVKNESAPGISEVELLSQERILGEKENLAPGLAATNFTLTLTGGQYQIYCPGATTENRTFTVTGTAASTGASTTQQLLADGAKGYGTYVANTLADMVVAVGNLKTAVDSGDVAKAKEAYAKARPFYEKIESDVEGFVLPGKDATDNKFNLDYLIDMRASNLDPAVGWSGFHAIERDLWQNGKITDQTKTYAADLQKNVGTLAGLAKSLTYKPEDLANGAASLLEEVQSNKIKGEEESYSHLDLVDFAANVEGAQQAFAYLKPGLDKIDPTLSAQVATQFKNVETALEKYRDDSALGGYKAWTPELRATDAAALSKAVQALQDPLSRIAEKVATAQ